MDFNQFFEASSEQEWREKIIKDLKGGNIEDLNWQSEIGAIDPVLFSYQNKYNRVDAHIHQKDNSWLIAQTYDCGEPKAANKTILEGLKGGVNCIKLINAKSQDLKTLLSEVMVDIIEVRIYIEQEGLSAFQEAIAQLERERKITLTGQNILLLVDPIGCYIAGHVPTPTPVSTKCIVRTAVFEQAGSSLHHELGYTIAEAHEYLLNLMESGVTPLEAAQMIYFEVAIGNSYFQNIAKVRALRILWDTVLQSYDIDFKNVNISGITSTLYQSNLDIHNNLLRGTTGAMSAVIAGVHSMEVVPYDQQLSKKRSDALRLSKNISLLLQEEAYLSQVKNAGNGSYYIEQLTDLIIEKSWKVFQSVEKDGGFLSHFRNGSVVTAIHSDLQEKMEKYKNETLVLVGSNKFPNSEESNEETYRDMMKSEFLPSYRLSQTKC